VLDRRRNMWHQFLKSSSALAGGLKQAVAAVDKVGWRSRFGAREESSEAADTEKLLRRGAATDVWCVDEKWQC
jgi:hypothetical protein